jgi:hypothetical protein
MGVFSKRSIHHGTAAASSFVAMVGATPYMLFLKVPWANRWLASSDSTFRTRKKAAGAEIGELGGFGVISIPFYTR